MKVTKKHSNRSFTNTLIPLFFQDLILITANKGKGKELI